VLAMLGLGGDEAVPEAGAPGGEPLTGNLLEQTFTMDGQPHTLTLKLEGNRTILTMASVTPRDIRNAANAGLDEARAKNMDATIVAELEAIVSQTKQFDEWVWENYEALVLPARDDHEQTVAQARAFFDLILHGAIEFGRKHHFKDLVALGHPSKYVLNDEIRDEYRSDWRELFYKKDWSSAIENSWKLNELARLRDEAAKRFPNHIYVVDPTKQAFLVEDRNGQYPPSPEVDYVRPRNVHIDHVRSVSDHFQGEGNSQIQSDREKWYELEKNLQILNERWNLAKSGPQVTNWHVTLSFRGPGE
jgi:hypothetical protein